MTTHRDYRVTVRQRTTGDLFVVNVLDVGSPEIAGRRAINQAKRDHGGRDWQIVSVAPAQWGQVERWRGQAVGRPDPGQ